MRMVITEDRYAHLDKSIRSAGPGLVAEVGVAHGGVVERLARIFPGRTVYAYDTFTGLPKEKWEKGEMQPGEFAGKGVEEALGRIPNVVVRKGLFPETMGDETGFVVVHLDLDYYLSTLEALKALGPRMAPGGRIVLDDWEWPLCPGVKRAVTELGLKAVRLRQMQAEISY